METNSAWFSGFGAYEGGDGRGRWGRDNQRHLRYAESQGIALVAEAEQKDHLEALWWCQTCLNVDAYSGYHSDSDSTVMMSGNSPFVSKTARYNFLSRSGEQEPSLWLVNTASERFWLAGNTITQCPCHPDIDTHTHHITIHNKI